MQLEFIDEPPVGFVGGSDAINACFVGTTADGVVLAFRGTLPPSSPEHEHADDIVPLLPSSLPFRRMFVWVPFMKPYVHRLDLDYSSVGTLRYITEVGAIVPTSPTRPFELYLSLAELMVAGGFGELAEDHRSVCGGGYLSAVCPLGVCP